MRSIHSFINRKIVVLNQNTQIQVAAKVMRDNQIGCVLAINDEGHLTGIVTDRDFACRWATEYSLSETPISQIMSHELIAAHEESKLDDIISIMENWGIRRVPIISRDLKGRDKAIGIVTLDDLIAAGSIPPNHLSQIVKRQIGRRLTILSKPFQSARSERRSEAHAQQTLDRFYTFIGNATGLSPDIIPQLTYFLLGCIMMRITATAAGHFIAQLPKLIQEDLLRLPPGPDRTTTLEWMLSELVSRYQFTEKFSRSLLIHFFAGLEALMDQGQIRNLKAQLPKEFKALFSSDEVEILNVRPAIHALPKSVMTLTSPAFKDGDEIPQIYTGEGADKSPPLEWSQIPKDAKEFALIMEDLDLTYETSWVHWILYGLSSIVTSLPEGLQKVSDLEIPSKFKQGKNSWGNLGYQGPMPPTSHPKHQYVIRLYALDQQIVLPSGITRVQLATEIQGHIIAEAQLTVKFQSTRGRRIA